MSSLRRFLSHRLIWLALLVSVGIGALFARAVWTIRNDEWNYAVQNNNNLARTLEQGLRWSLDSIDKSLEGAAREAALSEVWGLPPDLRNRVIFDNSLRAGAAGDVLVLDAQGRVVLDPAAAVPEGRSLAERDYFRAFAHDGHKGLFIGAPTGSSQGGKVLPLARSYHFPDGRFGGVVVVAIRVGFFNEIFGTLRLGEKSGINLLRQDGIVISRFPYSDADVGKNLAGTPSFMRVQRERSGTFVGKAALDGVERLYSFRPVGDYPLIINVAQAKDTILAQWYRSAWLLGGFACLLMAACIGLAMLFVRELGLRQKVSAQLRAAEHDVRTILNNMPSMIGYWDAGLHNRFANQAYVEWFGRSPEQLRGLHISELLGPELYERNRPFLERALQGEPQLFERTMFDPQGNARHTMISYHPDRDDTTGEVRGIFAQATDISERKRMEDELFDEKERVRLTLQSIGDAVVCADAQGVVTYLNPVAERLTGWQAFDAAGRPIEQVLRLRSPHNDSPMASTLLAAIRKGSGTGAESVRGVVVHRTSGQRFEVAKTVSPITDRHGHITGAVAVLRDVTEAVAMAERMAHLAQYDALTDLPNRVLLHDRAELALAQSRRSQRVLAVMYVDLDGFKQINDRLGHDMGDVLLVQFAQRLKAAVRASDTVCRQGGDEFVVLLPGLDGEEAACAVARKIMAACDLPFDLGPETVRIGLSGGIALYPGHGDSFDELSRRADEAMYDAKRGGRMRFMLYAGPDAASIPVMPTPPAAAVDAPAS